MLTIHDTIENWRELAMQHADPDAEHDDAELEAEAMRIRESVLDALRVDGIRWMRARQQSVGAFVIIQRGPKSEADAFHDAVDDAVGA